MHSALKTGASDLPKLITKRPMLMLTGFLGAGKTTFLREILGELSREEIQADVLLNDRENAQIDRETLRDQAASVAALTGSCVCCEGLDELCGMILAATKSPHEVLLIELNGTADPVPLQESFTLLESQFLLHPRWQVCVIDSRYFGQRSRFRDLEALQLETASHYHLSHVEGLSENAEQELIQTIEGINARASQTTAASICNLLGEAIRKNSGHAVASVVHQKESSNAVEDMGASVPRPHLHDKHQLAHEFTGCNIVFPTAVDPEKIPAWMEQLPDSVIRAKALITITTDPDRRFLYERVGTKVSPCPIPVRQISKIPCSGLFIGPDLKPEEILQLTREMLHPDCHFP
jgi:G3E family GTPase